MVNNIKMGREKVSRPYSVKRKHLYIRERIRVGKRSTVPSEPYKTKTPVQSNRTVPY